MEKYQDLKTEIGRLWRLKMIEVVPAVIGPLGSVTKDFDVWIEKLQITNNVGVTQRLHCWEFPGYLEKCWTCKEKIILLAFGHLL